MQTLKPNQILIVILIATTGTLAAIQVFNVYQAVCFGMVLAIFVYSFILSWEDKKPPTKRF